MAAEYQRNRCRTRERILVLCSGQPACVLKSSWNQPCCRDLKTKIPCVFNGHQRTIKNECRRDVIVLLMRKGGAGVCMPIHTTHSGALWVITSGLLARARL
jgi:hypothetical protein